MKFSVTRLCGGKALMAASADRMDIDLGHASEILSGEGFVTKSLEDGLMLVMDWNGMEVTLYPQGKIMFHPLSDKDTSVRYATDILEKVR